MGVTRTTVIIAIKIKVEERNKVFGGTVGSFYSYFSVGGFQLGIRNCIFMTGISVSDFDILVERVVFIVSISLGLRFGIGS